MSARRVVLMTVAPTAIVLAAALAVMVLGGCITQRQCVATCEQVLQHQASEISARQIREESDCMLQKIDLDTCRNELRECR